jgi:hypothetical protein
MLDKQANEAFYEWEETEYGDTSPLSDNDRLLWCEGFKQGVKHLFEYVAKNGGV